MVKNKDWGVVLLTRRMQDHSMANRCELGFHRVFGGVASPASTGEGHGRGLFNRNHRAVGVNRICLKAEKEDGL